MILPVLITGAVAFALLLSAKPSPLVTRSTPSPAPEPLPPEPTPPSPTPPAPRPNARPFAGLPYGAVVRLLPEKNIFGRRGGTADVVKIVGETNPGSIFSAYLAIDTKCFLPDSYCSRATLLETEIAERVS